MLTRSLGAMSAVSLIERLGCGGKNIRAQETGALHSAQLMRNSPYVSTIDRYG